MVTHQAIAMAQPMIIRHNRTQDFQESFAVVIIVKNIFPPIST